MILLLLFMAGIAAGQDLAQIKNQKPVTFNGALSLGYTATSSSDTNRVPMPSFWNASLNLNISLYGVSIPLMAVVTNGKFEMSNSFSRFGLSPRYKWMTFHGGYRQFSYSPFSIAGQTLLGGGIDLNPGILRIGAFYGRLRKAVALDTSLFRQTIPDSYPLDVVSVNGNNLYTKQGSYSCFGWGLKLGIGKQSNYVDLIVFKASDRVKSLKDTLTKNRISPEENFVVGINTLQKFGSHVTFGFNAATSAFTYNANADTLALIENTALRNLVNQFITLRPTTQLQWAGDVNFGLNFKYFSLATAYRRIEPYYKSMGMVSYINDLRSISIQPSFNLLKNKVRLVNSIQWQHDNLNNYKLLTTRRAIINSALSLNTSDKWGFDLAYNNYGMKQEFAHQAADSIKSQQQSHTLSLMPRLMFVKESFTNMVMLVASYTDINGKGTMQGDSNHVRNFYTTINNNFTLNQTGWNFTAGLNYNKATTIFNTLTSAGFIAGISRSFFENKLGLSNNNTILFNRLDGAANGTTFSIDLSARYLAMKKHSFSLGFNYLNSPANGIYNKTDFHQSRIMLAYQYAF